MARSFVQLSMDERRVIARMHEKKISVSVTSIRISRVDSIFKCNRDNIGHDFRRMEWPALLCS
ncbi:hypothetical protein ASC97_05500 [Rhizobium sp. Root1203]|uniref:hypothetical protein n=1 Tax=Rhizobium sp. Root1203 TaxID=1736427 RepID=UPI00070BD1BB|nr:hypothetical protein [Rhizobium sp. Root1203]KQV27823.1 hypothetical protein ASC97_05500 [Rhizobium sp. Root1203]